MKYVHIIMDYGRMVKIFAYNAAENIPNFVCVLLPSLVVHEFYPQSKVIYTKYSKH